MKKIKYDFQYIKKNLDLKQFVKSLNSESKWDYRTDGTNIINSAIKACANKKNKDPNLKGSTDGLKPIKKIEKIMMSVDESMLKNKFHILDYQCFFSDEYIIRDKNGTEKLWKPSQAQLKSSKKFSKNLEVLKSNGKLLTKISDNFKLIHNLKFLGEDEKDIFDTNTLLYSKVDKKYYYVWNHVANHVNEVIKTYKIPLSKDEFVEEIFEFKRSRGWEPYVNVFPM